MKRGFATFSAVLAGGVLSLAGLALSLVVTFFAMFYGLRVVCWLTGTDDWMSLMWLGIFLVPAGGVLGFALCVTGATAYIQRRRERQRQGFEVVPDAARRDAR